MSGHRHQGFTLVEIAIAISIIALLIGGILVGRDMIIQAHIRGTISQIEKYNSAATAFQNKYDCLPGDCSKATAFFGSDPQGCNLFNNTPRTTGTCNGDGDGTIAGKQFNAWPATSTAAQEQWRFWQQLWLAGLISDGPFAPSGSPAEVVGIAVPRLKLRDTAGVDIHWYNSAIPCCYQSSYPDFNGIHTWTLGSSVNSSEPLVGMGITANEAHSMDVKLDDGNAITGSVRAFANTSWGNACASSSGAYFTGDTLASWGKVPLQGCYIVMPAAF